jgi:arabinoxylan arabinofuranohydrolase
MKMRFLLAVLSLAFSFDHIVAAPAEQMPWNAPGSANPILPGYYADPSVVSYNGKHYMYATLDPWGDKTLGCWESVDFKNWTYRELNWPTKAACTSPTSAGAMVWAPSVVRAKNGKFFMYVSVGNEVWVGTADHPLGPWRNALGDRPLVPADYNPAYHMIDAEAFIDDDGSAYLYWGSGWKWVNGHCFAVKLSTDMTSFDGEVRDVTPDNYFEGPFMVKHAGRYFLTYSQGKTISDTYQVHYAVGDSPLGPFKEARNSPILVTDHARNIVSPGHHAVFTTDGRGYIAYHRHSVPYVEGKAFRQLCVDELQFTPAGEIARVAATHRGPDLVQGRVAAGNLATVEAGAKATASSSDGDLYAASCVLDDNYATRWAAAKDAAGAWLQIDLAGRKKISRQIVRFEYAWKPYSFAVEASDDGETWRILADHRAGAGVAGSPVTIEVAAEARYLRLTFPNTVKGETLSVWEWLVY